MSPYSRMVSLTAFEFFPFYLILCGYGRETAFIEMYPGKKQSWAKPVWFCHAATSQAKACKSPGARRLPENTGADILVFRQKQVKATILYDLNNWAHMLSEGCVLSWIVFLFFFFFQLYLKSRCEQSVGEGAVVCSARIKISAKCAVSCSTVKQPSSTSLPACLCLCCATAKAEL